MQAERAGACEVPPTASACRACIAITVHKTESIDQRYDIVSQQGMSTAYGRPGGADMPVEHRAGYGLDRDSGVVQNRDAGR